MEKGYPMSQDDAGGGAGGGGNEHDPQVVIAKLNKENTARRLENEKLAKESQTYASQIEELTKAHTTLETGYTTTQKENALLRALHKEQVAHVDAVLKLADYSKVQIDGGKVVEKSISEVIAELKGAYPVLFSTPASGAAKVLGADAGSQGGGKPPVDMNALIRKRAGR
jgi:hypothetical protein